MQSRKHTQLLSITLGLISSAFAILLTQTAQAQIDPSSALLLNGGRASTRDTALESGRYTVRPAKADGTKREDARPIASKKPAQPQVQAQQSQGQDNQDSIQPVTLQIPAQPQPVQVVRDSAGPVVRRAPPDPRDEAARTAAAQRDDNLPRDSGRRFNLVELSIAPGYLYNNSDSYSFYRRYSTASPTIGASANVWFSPSTALHGSYLGTLSGTVNDSFNGARTVPATQQWFHIGVRSRKFFGPDSVAPVLTFGVDYFEYQFRVPGDSANRQKLLSSGGEASIEAEIPGSNGNLWTIGATFAPKLQHKESATAMDVQSGANVEANSVGISVGGRIQFERRDAIFWKLSHTVEKDVFSGDQSAPDPLTGTAPTGLTVVNTFTVFQLGYTWGN
jgi:hypothetical protein